MILHLGAIKSQQHTYTYAQMLKVFRKDNMNAPIKKTLNFIYIFVFLTIKKSPSGCLKRDIAKTLIINILWLHISINYTNICFKFIKIYWLFYGLMIFNLKTGVFFKYSNKNKLVNKIISLSTYPDI